MNNDPRQHPPGVFQERGSVALFVPELHMEPHAWGYMFAPKGEANMVALVRCRDIGEPYEGTDVRRDFFVGLCVTPLKNGVSRWYARPTVESQPGEGGPEVMGQAKSEAEAKDAAVEAAVWIAAQVARRANITSALVRPSFRS